MRLVLVKIVFVIVINVGMIIKKIISVRILNVKPITEK